MRQIHSTPKEGVRSRAKPMEPLEEGALGQKANKRKPPFPFTEDDLALLKRRFKELVQEGMTDAAMGKKLEEEIWHSKRSIVSKLVSLRKKGRIPPNPNKRERKNLTPEEESLLIKRFNELVQKGLTDHRISKELEQEAGRSSGTIDIMLTSLRKEGKLPPNPNKNEQKRFTQEQESLLIKRFNELAQAGVADETMGKRLEEEVGHPASSIVSKLVSLRKKGKIPPNPNKNEPKRFTREQESLLIRRFNELVQKEMTDGAISKRLAEETGRLFGSIRVKLTALRKEGKIPSNPKRREKKEFSPEEESLLIGMFKELAQAGMTDRAISKKLGEEAGRPFHSISVMIRTLRKKGAIPMNPNKQESRPFAQEDEDFLIKKFKELSQTGMTIKAISKNLKEEIGRSAGSIEAKIMALRKKGKIPNHPNSRSFCLDMTEDERGAAVDAVLEVLGEMEGSQ